MYGWHICTIYMLSYIFKPSTCFSEIEYVENEINNMYQCILYFPFDKSIGLMLKESVIM